MPTSSRNSSFVECTRIAESLTASATMVLFKFGVFERQTTSVTRQDLGVRSPIGRSKLVGHPAGDRFRWLSADAADGVRQVVDAVEHHLCGVCWAVGGTSAWLPNVHNIGSGEHTNNLDDVPKCSFLPRFLTLLQLLRAACCHTSIGVTEIFRRNWYTRWAIHSMRIWLCRTRIGLGCQTLWF